MADVTQHLLTVKCSDGPTYISRQLAMHYFALISKAQKISTELVNNIEVRWSCAVMARVMFVLDKNDIKQRGPNVITLLSVAEIEDQITEALDFLGVGEPTRSEVRTRMIAWRKTIGYRMKNCASCTRSELEETLEDGRCVLCRVGRKVGQSWYRSGKIRCDDTVITPNLGGWYNGANS